MWIEEKEQNGKKRYCYRERYLDTLTGKNKIASITLNSNSNKAKKQAIEMLQAKIDKKLDRAGIKENRTFESILEEWFEQFKITSNKSSTIEIYETAKNNIIKLLPSGALLNAITATDIQKILDTWYFKKNRSYSGTMNIKTVISSTLQYAKKSKYIKDISFFYDVQIKRKPVTSEQKSQKENKFLTTTELKTIIAELNKKKKNRLALAVEFQSLTGLRFGEMVALRERDFDEINKRVNVNGTIAWKLKVDDKDYRQNTTKNIYSQRWVTLNQRCVNILHGN
jgi:integrase